jgi:hypothetical protein
MEGEEPNDKSNVVATLLSMPYFQYPFLVNILLSSNIPLFLEDYLATFATML